MKQKKLLFIDNLRAFATIFVMLWHLMVMFWHSNSAVSELIHTHSRTNVWEGGITDIVNALAVLRVDFGQFGVAIFFLISGFIIPYSVRNWGGVNKLIFLLKKFLRIWPVYAVGFGITFLALQFYGKFSNGEWIFSFKDYLIQASLLRDWFWIPSIDGISWTLEIEIKFYLFFFLLFVLHKESNPKIISGIAVVVMVLAVLYGANTETLLIMGREWYIACSNILNALVYILYILMGLGVYCLYTEKWDRKVWVVVEEVLAICFFISCHWVLPDLEIGYRINYTLAFLVFINTYMLRDRITQGKFLQFFSNNSFAIYILHGVNGYILLTIFCDMGIPPYINLSIVIAIILFMSWLFHRYIETSVDKLTKYVVARLSL